MKAVRAGHTEGSVDLARLAGMKSHAKVSAAQAEVKDWVDERKTATRDKISEWKAKRETSKLQNRADKAGSMGWIL